MLAMYDTFSQKLIIRKIDKKWIREESFKLTNMDRKKRGLDIGLVRKILIEKKTGRLLVGRKRFWYKNYSRVGYWLGLDDG